jgi:hypothetical protein
MSDIEAGKAAVSGTSAVDDGLVAELVVRARAGGVKLTGEGGRENYRNGRRSRTVITESGPVEISVPRDRAGSFEPQLVKKRQRRLGGVDETVLSLSLSAKGLTRGDVRASRRGLRRGDRQVHDLDDHRQCDGRHDGMAEPSLDSVYPVVFIDSMSLSVTPAPSMVLPGRAFHRRPPVKHAGAKSTGHCCRPVSMFRRLISGGAGGRAGAGWRGWNRADRGTGHWGCLVRRGR